jgi:hypothetical protein
MSISEKDFEEMVDKLDAGQGSEVPVELKELYDSMISGIDYMEESAFREKLKAAHEAFELGKSGSSKRYFWIGGIAASIVGFLFWMNTQNADPTKIELQLDEAPAYADSAR